MIVRDSKQFIAAAGVMNIKVTQVVSLPCGSLDAPMPG